MIVSLATLSRVAVPMYLTGRTGRAGRTLEAYPVSGEGTRLMPQVPLGVEAEIARLGEASASGFRLRYESLVPEEPFDAIGELAGRRYP